MNDDILIPVFLATMHVVLIILQDVCVQLDIYLTLILNVLTF